MKIVSQQNIVGNARDLEKASIRRSLQTLMKGLRVMVIQFAPSVSYTSSRKTLTWTWNS